MAETTCRYCGHKVGTPAKYCPECGKPLKEETASAKVNRGFNDHLIMVVILMCAAALFVGYQFLSPDASADVPGSKAMNAQMDMQAFIDDLPKDYDALLKMGNALMDQGQYNVAVECYKKALTQKADDADVRVDLATCQHALGQNEEAIANFQKVLVIQPDHQVAKFNLGIVYYTLGQDQKAADMWHKLLSENPSNDLKMRTQELLQKLGHN